jgi:HTH-type transcriptional regulator/antitoxin HigA
MEQSGLQPRDLIPFIGSRNRVHEGLSIPAESLIKIGRNTAA